jgi:prevent-host-death family protein
MRWQVQEAKQRFSELLRRTREEGPQVVTKHGEEVAFVVDAVYYRQLTGIDVEFRDHLLHGPKDAEFAEIMEQIVADRGAEQPASSRDDWIDDLMASEPEERSVADVPR